MWVPSGYIRISITMMEALRDKRISLWLKDSHIGMELIMKKILHL